MSLARGTGSTTTRGAAKRGSQPFAGLVSSFTTAANPERREEPGVTPRGDGGLQFRVDARVARERPLGRDLRSASHQRWRRAQLSFACRFDRIGLVRRRCYMATGKDPWQGGKTPKFSAAKK